MRLSEIIVSPENRTADILKGGLAQDVIDLVDLVNILSENCSIAANIVFDDGDLRRMIHNTIRLADKAKPSYSADSHTMQLLNQLISYLVE